MSKFQVGDRVIGVGTCGFWNIEDQIGTVRCYSGKDVGVEFDNPCGVNDLHHNPEVKCRNKHGLYVREWNLKKIDTAAQRIHITSDGTTTVAVLKDGKRTVKRAEAKCAPSDTYDFKVGARLAFDRLMGDGQDKPQYYNGKVVCVASDSPPHAFTVGKVYEYKNGIVNSNADPEYNKGDPATTKDNALNRHLVTFIPLVEDKPTVRDGYSPEVSQ